MSEEAHEQYHYSEDRSLSDAVLDTIEEQKGHDLTKGTFQLYDDIDPDALDNLFRDDAGANTSVQFNTDDVTVTLWGDGTVEIQVKPQHDKEV